MRRAGTIGVLALCFWGCGAKGREVSCTVDSFGAWRVCAATCPEGVRCFKRKEAHCFRNGPLYCTPTPEECNALMLSVGAQGAMCRPVPADEI